MGFCASSEQAAVAVSRRGPKGIKAIMKAVE